MNRDLLRNMEAPEHSAAVSRPSLVSRLASFAFRFVPKHLDDDSTAYFRAQAIVCLSLIIGASGFPFIFVFWAMDYHAPASVVAWTFTLFWLLPLGVRKGWRPHLIGHLVSANYYQCHLLLALLFGGVTAPNAMWFIGLPIIAILMGGVRDGVLWGLVGSATILILYVGERIELFSFEPLLSAREHVFVHSMGMVGLLFAIFGSAVAYESLKESALERRRKVEADLMQANKDLKVLDRQKTSFFQNMSHELRTPLTLILGPMESLRTSLPDNEDAAMATKNARRLLRLVNQLLDFQKLEAGKKELQLEPLNLSRFTHVIGDYFASACSTKDISFKVTQNSRPLRPEDRLMVLSEVDALEKVAFNFLSNALKYTPRGGHIELGLQPISGLRVRLLVVDSGPGISEEGKAKLFKVFSQVEASATREFEGTGLGLALVKSLVEEMGGSVGVQSALGHGATFFAELPLIESEVDGHHGEFKARTWLLDDGGETGIETSPEEEGSEALDTEGGGQLVLIVDDLEDMRNLIGSALTKRGYRTLKAANGEQGYQLICERKPDLVISDWMMPKLTGPEMLSKMRANEEVATTPFVLLTAKSDEESKLIGTELGADIFLGKPFNDQELGSAVRNLLSLKSREKEVQQLNNYITEGVLKRYLPPTLIGDILSGELSMDKPAELRTVTVLFSDLEGFTSTSERLGPEGISAFLNRYLTLMNEVIFEHGGTIDKFIGDAIMVLFGAPQDMPSKDQALRAARCARAMQNAMKGLTEELQATAASTPIMMRIGIHYGPAVVGNFGSAQRSDYTAIGPTVNMASRIESSCPPGHVLVSDEVAHYLPADMVEHAGEFSLKGIEGSATLHRIV